MAAIEHRFVAGLAPESGLWTQTRSVSEKSRWSEVHLVQSELDSGCGLHCLLCALMILLGLSRSEVLNLATARRGPLSALWHVAREHYFEGTDSQDLMAYVAAIGSGLMVERHAGPAARIVKAATTAVLAHQVPLLRVVGNQFDHWLLLAGVERAVLTSRRYQTLALLALDPGERSPWLTAYTGRIDVAPRVHRRTAAQVAARKYSYRSLSGDNVSARLAELLVLKVAQAP